MLTERRIIALTDKNSTTWNIVDKKSGECFVHTDIENIMQALIGAWKAWKKQDKDYRRAFKEKYCYLQHKRSKKIHGIS